MGVKKLYKFLKEKNLIREYPNLTRYVNSYRKFGRKSCIKIAIDFWLFAHKFTYSYGNMIQGFWNQIVKLLSHRIIPIYIYDGTPPSEKNTVLIHRNKKKTNMEEKLNKLYTETDEVDQQTKIKLEKSIINIKKDEVDNVKLFFDSLGIPYLTAIGEADALCAKLYKEDYITACLSDDMDMLALGCGRTIKFLDGKVLEFNLEYILSELQLSHEQFVEMCLMFGCDYIRPSFRVNNIEIYELIKKYKSIDTILDQANHDSFNRSNEKCISFILGYANAKKIILTSANNEKIQQNLKIKITNQLDPFVILKFLKKNNDVYFLSENTERIFHSIEYINYYISNSIFQ